MRTQLLTLLVTQPRRGPEYRQRVRRGAVRPTCAALLSILVGFGFGCGGSTSARGNPATGGTSGTAGSGGAHSAGSAGRPATGGRGGGAGSGGAAGAAGTAGTTGARECTNDADCHVVGDCCGCWSLPIGVGDACPLDCAIDHCTDFTTRPTARCVFGQCALDVDCTSPVSCTIPAPPPCGAGRAQTVVNGCYGPCISTTECPAVADCSECNWPAQACVFEYGALAVAHCVDVAPKCSSDPTCTCLGDLCGSITPCTDLSDGIACGGG